MDNEKSWHRPVAAVGLLFVIVGIVGETICEGRVSVAETSIQGIDESKLGDAIQKAAALDLATQGLKTDAATAKRDMMQAQLDLNRITGPPYAVPVIHGIARLDLSQSATQFVLLARDIRIPFPALPKGHHLDWTLILAQDSVGQHQFTTEPFDLSHGNTLFNPPESSWVCKLTTDSFGTRKTDSDCGFNAPNQIRK